MTKSLFMGPELGTLQFQDYRESISRESLIDCHNSVDLHEVLSNLKNLRSFLPL